MSSKNILLVGGCGFIGHNLALYLKQLGHKPVIVDSLSVNNILSFVDNDVKNKKLYSSILQNRIEILNKKDIQLIIQDARDYHSISKIYNDINPDIINNTKLIIPFTAIIEYPKSNPINFLV